MKKLFIVISFIPFFLSFNLFAKALNGDSKIHEVTVFKNWAFVKRIKKINFKKGNYSLKFEGVTPSLDKDSLKVRVLNKNNIQILGIRNKIIFKKKEDNKKLNVLYEKKDELNKILNGIRKEVSLLFKENGDLSKIKDHYGESFTLNLHKKKWNKNSLQIFFKFLDKRNKLMYGKWKNAYKKFIATEEKLKFIRVKISELVTIADEKVFNIFVDVKISKGGNNAVELLYLVKNVGWMPVYDVRINSSKGQAAIEQYAMVWQNTGENWKDVSLTISNNRAELKVDVPSISSYTLSYREVKKVKTIISSAQKNQSSLDDTVGNEKCNEEKLFKNFVVKAPQTVNSNAPKNKVFLNEVKVPYTEHLELVSKQYPYVYKKGKLRNAFSWSLAAGEVYIYYDDSFLQSFYLDYVPKGKDFYINAGIEHSLIVKRRVNSKTNKASIIGRKNEFHKAFSISIKNHSTDLKKVKIIEQVPYSETSEIEVSTEGSTKGFEKLAGKPSWIFWNVDILSQKESFHKLNVSVKVPKDFRFTW